MQKLKNKILHNYWLKLKLFGRFWRAVFERFLKGECFYRACALTFTTLLAIVPLMVVTFTILSEFPVFDKWGMDVQNFIFANFVPSTGQSVQNYLLGFVLQASQLSMLGMVFLLITSVLMLYTIDQALNAIWEIKESRRPVYAFMLYCGILTLSPFLMGLGFALSAHILALPFFNEAIRLFGIDQFLVSIVTFLIATSVFSLLYTAVPKCRVPLRYGLLGGLFAATLFEVAKYGFIFYLKHFPTYQLLYGTLAVIPMFLIWIDLLWLITLLGAEVSRALVFRHAYIAKTKLDGFSHAFRWLGYLWDAQLVGKGLSLLELVEKDRCNYQVSPEQQIKALTAANLICKGSNSCYFISGDLHCLTVGDFYQKLPWKLPDKVAHLGITARELALEALLIKLTNELSKQLDVTLADFMHQTRMPKDNH